MFMGKPKMPELVKPDMLEYGAATESGEKQTSDRRLFVQLQVFTDCLDAKPLIEVLKNSECEFVLYEDLNDPRGVGILSMAEDPALFIEKVRPILNREPFQDLILKPELTMLGRTYAIGREPNLEDWLLEKPKRNALNKGFGWAIWYPLRRKPEFALLSGEEHGKVLMEHAMTGRAYGESGLCQDIRLACHGLDQNDNEFVIGLVSDKLHPLSRIVQDMRKTQQTAKYIQSLGPFFVGRVLWQSEPRRKS